MEDRAGEIGNLPQPPTTKDPILGRLAAKHGVSEDSIYQMIHGAEWVDGDRYGVIASNYYTGRYPDMVDLANVLEITDTEADECIVGIQVTRAECVALGRMLLDVGLDPDHWPADDPGIA